MATSLSFRLYQPSMEGVEQGLLQLLSVVAGGRCGSFGHKIATLYEDWLHARRGLLGQGFAELRASLDFLFQYNVGERPYLGSLLPEALARAGHVTEGLYILEEGLEQTERTGERWSEAELHRLQGELLLQRGDDPEVAEACYRRAIEVAQRQEARSWELRATTSLTRLLQAQGRATEAREMLAATYGWFTEGFDTPDLREAKALLDELVATA